MKWDIYGKFSLILFRTNLIPLSSHVKSYIHHGGGNLDLDDCFSIKMTIWTEIWTAIRVVQIDLDPDRPWWSQLVDLDGPDRSGPPRSIWTV